MIFAAFLATVLYTLIGIAPGTDETAVLAPVTLVLVLTGFKPIVILTFFMAAIVAKKLTDSIPVADCDSYFFYGCNCCKKIDRLDPCSHCWDSRRGYVRSDG